jgi:hypothetical protein
MNKKMRPALRGGVAIGLFLLTLFGLNDGLEAGEVGGTSGWNTYSNEEAGLSFKYPRDWLVEVEGFYETAGGERADLWSLTLYRRGAHDDSDNWIRFNPRQFQESEGRCIIVSGNAICTYSRDEQILEIVRGVADTTVVNRLRGSDASRPSGSASEATVNAPGDGFLALRSEPSTKRGRRLAKIPHGTRLTLQRCDVAADGYHWCRTTFEGQMGWVADRYLSREVAGSEGEILRAVAGACPADWCEASVEKVIGGYASVLLHCKKPNCDSILAFLKRSKGQWTLVDYGSGLTAEDLVGYGFPADVAEQLAY